MPVPIERNELEEHQMQAIIHAKSAIDYAKVAIERQGQALDMAIIAGEHLAYIKGKIGHGNYLPWIEENMPVGHQQCTKYLWAFENPEIVKETKLRLGAVSINDVVKAIGQAKKSKPEPPIQAVIDLLNVDKAEEVYERLDGSGKHRLLSRIIHQEGFFYGSYIDLIPKNPHDKPNLCLAIARVIRQHSHPDKGGTDEELMAATEAYDKLKGILDNV